VPQDLSPLLSGEPDPRLDDVKDWLLSLDYWLRRQPAGASTHRMTDFREGLFELLAEITRTPGLKFDRVDAESNRVLVAADGLSIPMEGMSQGTASLLGWLGVLVRRLLQVRGGGGDPLERPALVLIDELDAHMHPAWQQVVVARLAERFPNIQFIATTHSPLVVAGLTADQVTRFRRIPGGGVVGEPSRFDLRGVGVAGLLTSALFSLASQLDPQTEEDLQLKRELAVKKAPTAEDLRRLAEVDERLRRANMDSAHRDPLYPLFVQAFTERRLAGTTEEERAALRLRTPEQLDEELELAREIIADLLKQEATEGLGDG
jgi:hypothetical protein